MVEGWPIGRGVLRIQATDNAAAGIVTEMSRALLHEEQS